MTEAVPLVRQSTWVRVKKHWQPVGLAWIVMLGFARLMSSRQVLLDPMSTIAAVGHIRSWLGQPNTSIVSPGPTHLDLVEHLSAQTGGSSNLVTDSHLAALAIEHQADLHSNDADFARFPGLRWRNPIG